MPKKKYDNNSIKSLKGADRVRKRPGVIFGSNSIEGTEHTFFEILSNSIDEAKDGFGDIIEVHYYPDMSISVKDYGRGIPLDFNKQENRFNWELVFCELYAGGKYDDSGENYEFSLGLNGLGACATQYASEFFDVEVVRDGYQYNLHFEKGENIGGLKKKKNKDAPTGTYQHYKPDLDVFTDIDIPVEYFKETLKRQAMINARVKFVFYDDINNEVSEYYYENGIVDYIKEINNGKEITEPYLISGEGTGKDREDKPEYKVQADVVFCFNNNINKIEYYHNSSFLEHGGSPDIAVKNAFVYVFDKLLKDNNKYNKSETKITFNDIQDSLVLISNSFSTQTSYENQTKKSITNKFVKDFLTELLKRELEIWASKNNKDALKIMEQILLNKRSREKSEEQRLILKKKGSVSNNAWDRVKKFVDCKSKDPEKRELFIVEGDSALTSVKLGRDSEFQAIMPIRGRLSKINLPLHS